ncbi:hypothetical protein KC364_g60 [Hortaea werneckii]|nr:hypothetical protein KC364_g60 [Hortaea werneckii]
MRIEDRLCRAEEGSSKSSEVLPVKRPSIGRATGECGLVLLTAEEGVPIGMDLMIGVESVLRSKRTKAARKIMDRGVAGRRSPMMETKG